MNFTDIFIRRPVLATVVSLLILLIGLRSLQLLNVGQYPKSESAVVYITTAYVGADAELVKGFITTLLEREIASADGIDYIESSSVQGVSSIMVHLKLNYPPYDALTQIQSKINQVRANLPVDSEEPVIELAVGETTAAMYLSFASKTRPANQITDYLVRVVQPKLEAVAGVQRAAILGGRNFAMRIWLNPGRMHALQVTARDVYTALVNNNYQAAVGKTKGDAISVNLNAATDLISADGFRELVVTERDGEIIRLHDVATVVLGAESYETSVAFKGEFATFIAIDVLPTANALEVIREIRAMLPDIIAQLPNDVEGIISYDKTRYIEDAISEVVKTLTEAVLIVMAVIFLFLGSVRSVAIPIIAIPLSLIGAAGIMLVLGYTINLLTLLAMVLSIGLVVDDAIIVVENIQRHIEEGLPARDAAITGARELAVPVIAMTITLFAVYAPIGFSGGLTGSLFREFAFTLAGAVIISGIVALTLSPMMCSRLLGHDHREGGLSSFLDRQFVRLREMYHGTLHRTLDYVPVTLTFAVIVLISIYFMFVTSDQELAPMEDQGIALVMSTAAPNTSLEQLSRYTAALIRSYEDLPETEQTFLFNGSIGSNSAVNNLALSGIVLRPWSERSRSLMDLLPDLQHQASQITGLQSVAFSLPAMPGAGSGLPVEFVISSTDEPLVMYDMGRQLVAAAYESGLFIYADIDMKYDRPQTNIVIDRQKAANLGIDMREIGGELGAMLGGNYVNRFSIQGRSYKVIPQVQRRYRQNVQQIGGFPIATRSGELIPLSSIVSFETSVQPQDLKRFQQLNSIMLSGVPSPGVAIGTALKFLEGKVDELAPQGYSFDYAGLSRQFMQEGSALILTFFFALVIIYLVLAAQFESFRDPLVMLISVPMSIAGALVFLTLGYATVNIYTQVGLITLIGLISKHGILIVEFANKLQQNKGLAKREAIEQAAATRLRPVLMTTGAMVLGVVPLLLASGAGAVSRYNLGLVIASGMSIGTLFTIFVVPAMYMVVAREHKQ
ncbi:MAG: efflux RND transporter permease subunit [Gammaproteobacteria bacterium]|jgi:multidrug efflux pump|nr:multidrug efflux protein [Chromatiales bacterium]MDP7418541.1 efflux RND transporter permease subunit [Gammaproteobacteria bacterium]MDP7660531.1 efflux RND transporter permease subunit [Gammaproteobacteria bacterium]HJP39669.1 efflux RND transporter permease subunit [Gammaproteobacteria bacterium]